MHILFSADAYLPRAGGSRVYYHNLYSRLAGECGQRITVSTKLVPGWEQFDRAANSQMFEVIRRGAPLQSWKFHHLQDLFRPLGHTLALLARLRPDMLHAGDLYPQGLIALFAKRFLGYPYIAFCHGEEVTQMAKQRTEPKLRDLIYRNADLVVCASAFARKTLLETGFPAERVEHITPGVDSDHFRPGPVSQELVEKFSLSGKLVLLTVARLVWRKGHARVLESLAALAPQFPNLCYLIAGTGPEEEKLRERARALGVEHLVRFAGYVSDAALPELYRACDVMVMPNSEEVSTGDIEGFGMVFLEASAAGKPVIGGRSGGAAEPVVEGQTGLLVDPENPAELTEALRRLLSSPEMRNQMGRTGRDRARSEFDWSSRAGRLCACSERVIRRKNAKEFPGGVNQSCNQVPDK